MIAHLTGKLILKSPEYVVVDVHGVGYGIFVTLNTYYELPETGHQITLLTYTHVREDTLKLYGFLSVKERTIFEQLIGISKIGPKLARNILSKLSVEELESAIKQAKAGLIHSIPGIGEKTAQRLILELKDKISKTDEEAQKYKSSGMAEEMEFYFPDAVSALVNLGYSKRESEKAVRFIMSAFSPQPYTLKDLIKHALDKLSG